MNSIKRKCKTQYRRQFNQQKMNEIERRIFIVNIKKIKSSFDYRKITNNKKTKIYVKC